MLDAAVAVNARQRKQVIAKLQRDLHTLKGKSIALLGLAFKPNTDDLREAPSLEIARALNSLGARVVGYDPVAGKAAGRQMSELKVVFDLYEALENVHAAVVVTEWEEVRSMDLERAAASMSAPKPARRRAQRPGGGRRIRGRPAVSGVWACPVVET